MANDYILVKDKDGKLKYFKDGKFFDLAEIEEAEKQVQAGLSGPRKKELKPIFTFEQKKPLVQAGKEKTAPEPVKPKMATPVLPVKKFELAPKTVKIEKQEGQKEAVSAKPSPAKEGIFEIEHLPADDFSQRRGDDQKFVSQHVNNVVARLKIQFHDEKIKSRFINLLSSFFRGLRAEKEVEYVLGMPKASGGLEIPKEKISLVLIVLRQEAEAIAKARRDIVVEKSVVEQAKTAVSQIAPPVPAISNQLPTTSRQLPDISQDKIAVPKKTLVTRPVVQKPTSQPEQPIKPRLENFGHARRLIGPIEELGAMNLENFRRLGKSENERMEALLEKFQVLKEQSLVKKMEGRQAWKTSPLFRLYIAMTLKGIQEKKSVSAVIEEKQIKNEECLTLSEYEMMGRLNREIGE